MADFVLGVDGGNTKTIALVARMSGEVVGMGRGECSDIYNAPSEDAALSEVDVAASGALSMAGLQRHDLAVGAFSMAGADWPEDFAFLRAALAERGLGRQVIVVNDGLGALRAGSLDGTGVVIACGTGTATAARSADGQVWHSSWWQEPQGSEQLASKALWAVYRAELGIDPPTALKRAVLGYYGKERVEDVLYLFMARLGAAPFRPGGLARILLDNAQDGDPAARRIVLDHGAALGDYANAAARQVGIAGTDFNLVLAGGVLRHPSSLLSDAIIERVRLVSPQVRPALSRFEPAVGALFLALEAAGVPISEALLAKLAPTLPPISFFAT